MSNLRNAHVVLSILGVKGHVYATGGIRCSHGVYFRRKMYLVNLGLEMRKSIPVSYALDCHSRLSRSDISGLFCCVSMKSKNG